MSEEKKSNDENTEKETFYQREGRIELQPIEERPEGLKPPGKLVFKAKTFTADDVGKIHRAGSPVNEHLSEKAKDEISRVWIPLLKVLMTGPSKPNSSLFELKKIDNEIKKYRKAGQNYEHLVNLRNQIVKCCPGEATVQDSLVYKNERAAILAKIITLTDLKVTSQK